MSNATTTEPNTIHPPIVESHDQPRVLCFGEALMHRINNPEATSENKANTMDRPGGAPASVACGVTRLGTPASFLGRIGDDPVGQQLLALFKRRQVSTPALQTDPQRPTRIARCKGSPAGIFASALPWTSTGAPVSGALPRMPPHQPKCCAVSGL